MKADVLRMILGEGGSNKGDVYAFAGDSTLMIDVGGDLVLVEKVKRAELKQDTYVVAETSRGDRYVVPVEAVRGLKLGRGSEGEGGPGFVA